MISEGLVSWLWEGIQIAWGVYRVLAQSLSDIRVVTFSSL